MPHLEAARAHIRERIAPVKPLLQAVEGLDEMFEKCFMNTLDTTVQETAEDTFVITGDIRAMWLRDSTTQVLHYLRFADDPDVDALLRGVMARQAKNILLDPYANAFNKEPSDYKPFDDTPRASDWVWERKYEVDSLCFPVLLAHRYLKATGRADHLTDVFLEALRTIVDVFREEQRHEDSPYRFQRSHCPPSDTLENEGRGTPVGYTGMTWSGFRPSDDACRMGYLVPSNLFAVQSLTQIAELAERVGEAELAGEAKALAEEIREGIEKCAVIRHEDFGEMYAYEVDGLGGHVLMDDANVPGLLSLKWLGICGKDDPRYRNSRAFALSAANPFFYEGKYARGIGSPHTPSGCVWPIALCVQAMTAEDLDETVDCLRMLLRTHAGTGFMHESFDPDRPEVFTRSWFAWANSMFGETLYRLYEAGQLEEAMRRLKA